MSDSFAEKRERKLIAEAREWSRVVESEDTARWRKGYVEDGLHHVARLSDALEVVLDTEASKDAENAHWLRDAGFGTTDADSDERRMS